jgi:hypothetical protein
MLEPLLDKLQGRRAITCADPAPKLLQRCGKAVHVGGFEGVPDVVGVELGIRVGQLGGDVLGD